MLGKTLMKFLESLRPRAAHILLVERDDGHTFLSATFNPRGRISALNGAGFLTHRWKVIDTALAEEIVERVGSHFEFARRDAFGPWFVADYDDVLRTLNDYDMATGRRWRDTRLEIGTRVQVPGAGRGHVKAFRGSRVVVKLEAPRGAASEVIAARSIVKPVLRLISDAAPV